MTTAPPAGDATFIYVAYRTTAVDTSWIRPEDQIVVVHNDNTLGHDAVAHPRVEHITAPGNIGFGRAVNLALTLVQGRRVTLCNPDTKLEPIHREALVVADPEEIVTIPLVDAAGAPTWVVNPYPTPISTLLTAYRVGRFMGRTSRVRALLTHGLGQWGHEHAEMRTSGAGVWPLSRYWASGAVLSVDTERIRSVGGFDERYFLFMEDVDLCARMADRYPEMTVRLADVPPGGHAVGGSASTRQERRAVDRHHLDSMRQYAAQRHGRAWRLAATALRPRQVWLSRPLGS